MHGLAADPVGTWVQKKEDWNWLENQLVDSLPRARVWTFGYDSSWCGDFSVDTVLHEVAGTLLDVIKAKVLLIRVSPFLQLRGLLICVEFPAYTSDLCGPQLRRYRRIKGDLSLEHHHVVVVDLFSR